MLSSNNCERDLEDFLSRESILIEACQSTKSGLYHWTSCNLGFNLQMVGCYFIWTIILGGLAETVWSFFTMKDELWYGFFALNGNFSQKISIAQAHFRATLYNNKALWVVSLWPGLKIWNDKIDIDRTTVEAERWQQSARRESIKNHLNLPVCVIAKKKNEDK